MKYLSKDSFCWTEIGKNGWLGSPVNITESIFDSWKWDYSITWIWKDCITAYAAYKVSLSVLLVSMQTRTCSES